MVWMITPPIMKLTRYAPDHELTPPTLLVLAHGAGAGQTHPFMVRYARGLAARGIEVFTFDFPYMEAGRKSPDKAPVLEAAFRDAVRQAIGSRDPHTLRLVLGGKSMGGRMATHLAAAAQDWPRDLPPISGVVALGYPLNPPGGAGRQDRVSHLLAHAVPILIVQGTRDSFGGPDAVRSALQGRAPHIEVHEVPAGDHSFAVLKSAGRTQAEIDADVFDAVSAWASRLRTPSAA